MKNIYKTLSMSSLKSHERMIRTQMAYKRKQLREALRYQRGLERELRYLGSILRLCTDAKELVSAKRAKR